MLDGKLLIGKEEWVSLPELNIPHIKVRVDSGAKTSSIHAVNIKLKTEHGKKFVYFDVNPIQGNRKIVVRSKAEYIEKREIKSSNGRVEKRYVIRTILKMRQGESWPIEVSLSNRDAMGYRMLLGREAMINKCVIDPEHSFLLEQHKEKEIAQEYSKKVEKRKLSIVLLASNKDLYSNKRIMEAATARGHHISFVNINHCYMNITASKPVVYHRSGEKICGVDAVIPRIKPALTFYGCAVTRQFELTGAFCLNNSVSISKARDKLRSMQILASNNLDMPATGFANSPLDTRNIIKMVGGAPLVIKLLEGTQGRGVMLADNNRAAENLINAFKSAKVNILIQEFIKEAEGHDIRCFVVDGKVVGAIERIAKEGEFRANLHVGGTAKKIRITTEERKLAIKAARVMGLKVAGVDLIRSKTGPKVLEVNSSPGLEGIESVTKKDIAGMMIEAIERNV